VADPKKELEGVLKEVHHLQFLRPKKVEQLEVIDPRWLLQEQIIRVEEGKVIPELGEQVVDPKKELEWVLREAHPLRSLRLKKVEQLEAIDPRWVLQEQIIRVEEWRIIPELGERVADPKKEPVDELRGAHHLNSLWGLGSQSEKVHPKNLDRFFRRVD
jgi:hypothetical protein